MTNNLPLVRVPPLTSVSWAGSSLSYNLLWKHWGCSTKTECCRVPVITKHWSVNVPQSNLNPFFKACSYLLSQMPVTNFIKATVLPTRCGFCSLTSSTVAWGLLFAFIATINLQKIKRKILPLYKVLQTLHLQTKANRFPLSLCCLSCLELWLWKC